MTIKNDTDAAGVAEVVAAFASGTLNDWIRSTGGLAKQEGFREAWAACGDCGLLGQPQVVATIEAYLRRGVLPPDITIENFETLRAMRNYVAARIESL